MLLVSSFSLNPKVNLLYVALTRAKKVLSVPSSVAKLIRNFRAIDHHLLQADGEEKKEPIRLEVASDPSVFSWEEVTELQRALVKPLQSEIASACGEHGLGYFMRIGEPPSAKTPEDSVVKVEDAQSVKATEDVVVKVEATPSAKTLEDSIVKVEAQLL